MGCALLRLRVPGVLRLAELREGLFETLLFRGEPRGRGGLLIQPRPGLVQLAQGLLVQLRTTRRDGLRRGVQLALDARIFT